jgi:choline dehydrogenase-like flavoprotein
MRAGTDFYRWANTAFETNKTGPLTIATGNLAAWLSFPVISSRYEEMASMLEKQDSASYLPDGTHDTVKAGYKAQMLSFANALRSNHTAFYNLGLNGSPGNGIQVDLHPLSRGTCNIDPKKPEAEPVVDYRALSNPMDAKVMADIMRYTRKYYLNEQNQKWGATEVQPGARVTTDEDMADYLARTLSPTEYHSAGSCAMMPLEMGGVVNEELKVYGVERLRIVDASIMPTLPGANTCQTTYALAEKVSRLTARLG